MSATSESVSSDVRINVLIVGAGLSGLTSAYKLLQRDSSLLIRILESSNVLGGQLATSRLGDLSGKWFTEDQHHLHCLLSQLNVNIRRRISLAPNLMNYREIDRGFMASLVNYELRRYIDELDLNICTFNIKRQKRSMTMYHHICRRLFFHNSRKYMMNVVLLITGAEAHHVFFYDFMFICHTSGGIKHLLDILIEIPQTMLEFSSGELLKNFIAEMSNIQYFFNRQVCEVSQFRDHVVICDNTKERHLADTVIMAIPLNKIQNIYFWPPMPHEIQIPPLPVDDVKYIITSFISSYRKAYWRSANYSGSFVCNDPFIVAYEYRPTLYCGYIIHEEGIEPLVKTIILHKFAECYGENMLLPLEYFQHSHEFHSMSHLALTTPWNRVIWSSSATSGTCYRGRLSGAVQSGLRAAINALLITRPQIVKWQDIAEIHCHVREYQTGNLKLWLSTWNLYNVTTYTLFVCGVVMILNHAYQKSR